jgi:hypothetical protein
MNIVDDSGTLRTVYPAPSERAANKVLPSSHNLLSDAHVGMIFFVPGVNESLRVNGQACITFDNQLCEEHAVGGKPARSVWVVTVDEAFFHCGKALIRSDLWNPEKRIERSKFPSYGKICADQFGGKTEDHEKYLEESYRTRLY